MGFKFEESNISSNQSLQLISASKLLDSLPQDRCGEVIEHFTEEEGKADRVISWLDGMYGAQFMGKDTSDRAYRNRRDAWVKVTAEYSLEVVDAALKAIPEKRNKIGLPVYEEWPPNPIQFYNICRDQKKTIDDLNKYGTNIQGNDDWRQGLMTRTIKGDLMFWRNMIDLTKINGKVFDGKKYFYDNCQFEPIRSLLIGDL